MVPGRTGNSFWLELDNDSANRKRGYGVAAIHESASIGICDLDIPDLEYEEREMINELLGKEVLVEMGISMSKMSGTDSVEGKIVEISGSWLKLMVKNKPVYLNPNHIKKISPQE